jgi:hypothetical protein
VQALRHTLRKPDDGDRLGINVRRVEENEVACSIHATKGPNDARIARPRDEGADFC